MLILIILWIVANIAFQLGPYSISKLKEVSGGAGIPDMMLGYDLATLNSVFTAYGTEGIAIYKKIKILDYIYPLIYTTLILGFLVRSRPPKQWRSVIYGNAFIILFLDYAENFILGILVDRYPFLTPDYRTMAKFASLLTELKWSFIALAVFYILVFSFRYQLVSKKKHRRKSHSSLRD
jgi:hypothetical protein